MYWKCSYFVITAKDRINKFIFYQDWERRFYYVFYVFNTHVLSGPFTTMYVSIRIVKFMFSKKATKFEKIFIVDLTLCSKCQIDCEDFVNFCGLLRKHELYVQSCWISRLEKSDGEVAVFDATNTTRERRKYLYQRVVLEKGNNFVSSLKGSPGVRRFGDSGRSRRSVKVIELESP